MKTALCKTKASQTDTCRALKVGCASLIPSKSLEIARSPLNYHTSPVFGMQAADL